MEKETKNEEDLRGRYSAREASGPGKAHFSLENLSKFIAEYLTAKLHGSSERVD